MMTELAFLGETLKLTIFQDMPVPISALLHLAILPLKYMLVCSAASWPSLTLLLPSAVSYVYKALISELLHLSQDYIGSVYSTLTEEQMPDAHTKYT